MEVSAGGVANATLVEARVSDVNTAQCLFLHGPATHRDALSRDIPRCCRPCI